MSDEVDPVLPGGENIRWMIHQGEKFYSLVDIIAFLTENEGQKRYKNPQRYWSDLKRRALSEDYAQVYAKIVRLKLPSSDGKAYLTDTANRETVLRIVQSVPSSTQKAEDIKLWLAESGEQRLQTFEQTQIDIEAERHKYRLEGRSEEWIEKRIQSILVRNELTQEWDERGARKEEYGLLTNTIAKGTFDLTPQQHKEVKGLRKENLRDHMTPMELVLTMLGEVTTTELHRDRESEGLPELQRDAKDGGAVAGRARQDIEKQLGTPVVSSQNFLQEPKKKRGKKQHLVPEGQKSLFLDQGSQDSNS